MKTLYILAVMFGGQHYVVDSNLSREDCGAIIAAGLESLTLEEGIVAVPEDAAYECTPQPVIPVSVHGALRAAGRRLGLHPPANEQGAKKVVGV